MRIKIISTCIISLFLLAGYEHASLEITKTKTSTKIELPKDNVEMNYVSNDLDCNQ
jgi:hypothetical protein